MSKGTTIKDALAKLEVESGQKPSEAEHVKLRGLVPPIEKMDASLSTLLSCVKLSLSTNNIEKIANLNGLKNLKILSLGRNNIKNLNGLEAVADTLEELWVSYNSIEKLKGIGVLKKLQTVGLLLDRMLTSLGKALMLSVGITAALKKNMQGLRYRKGVFDFHHVNSNDGHKIILKLDTTTNVASVMPSHFIKAVLYMSNNLVKAWDEFQKLGELPALKDLLFVGNPLEEKHSIEGDWRDVATTKLPKLKKLDGVPVVRQDDDEE